MMPRKISAGTKRPMLMKMGFDTPTLQQFSAVEALINIQSINANGPFRMRNRHGEVDVTFSHPCRSGADDPLSRDHQQNRCSSSCRLRIIP
jgi:hypothetical protein